MATQTMNSNGPPIREMQHETPTFPVDSLGEAPNDYNDGPPSVRSENRQERMKQNPLESLELDELDLHVKALFEKEFKDRNSVTEEELIIGARLARSSELFMLHSLSE